MLQYRDAADFTDIRFTNLTLSKITTGDGVEEVDNLSGELQFDHLLASGHWTRERGAWRQWNPFANASVCAAISCSVSNSDAQYLIERHEAKSNVCPHSVPQ